MDAFLSFIQRDFNAMNVFIVGLENALFLWVGKVLGRPEQCLYLSGAETGRGRGVGRAPVRFDSSAPRNRRPDDHCTTQL